MVERWRPIDDSKVCRGNSDRRYSNYRGWIEQGWETREVIKGEDKKESTRMEWGLGIKDTSSVAPGVRNKRTKDTDKKKHLYFDRWPSQLVQCNDNNKLGDDD